jgi:hypothetical protein
LELIDRRGFIRDYKNNGIECAKLTIPTHGIIVMKLNRHSSMDSGIQLQGCIKV